MEQAQRHHSFSPLAKDVKTCILPSQRRLSTTTPAFRLHSPKQKPTRSSRVRTWDLMTGTHSYAMGARVVKGTPHLIGFMLRVRGISEVPTQRRCLSGQGSANKDGATHVPQSRIPQQKTPQQGSLALKHRSRYAAALNATDSVGPTRTMAQQAGLGTSPTK